MDTNIFGNHARRCCLRTVHGQQCMVRGRSIRTPLMPLAMWSGLGRVNPLAMCANLCAIPEVGAGGQAAQIMVLARSWVARMSWSLS